VTSAGSDRHLLAAFRAGELPAFERIYARYATRVLSYLVAMVGDRNEAEELLQKVFVGFAGRARSLPAETNVRAYLFTSARNALANWHRGRSRRTRFEGEYEIFAQIRSDAAEDELTPLEREELRTRLNAALGRLSEGQREVVLLHTQGGLTFKRIARLTGAPQGTVASRYRAAILKLREVLSDE
jgi:RNA polymerase sigma-70 factor, ECF subfamily